MSELLKSLHFNSILFRGRRYDQKTVREAIHHLAVYLVKNNTSSSPFIMVSMYNHIKSVIAYYAILQAGKIAVILDPGCKSIEISEMIEDTDPGIIILLNNETTGFNYEEEIIFRSTKPGFIISSELSDVCTIAYTNAEDGYSKGAMLTEKNLMSEIIGILHSNKLNKTSVTYTLLPFSHLYGLVLGILIATHFGGTGIIGTLDLLKITANLEDIYSYKVTHLYSVPSVYYILSKCPGIDKLVSNVKMFVSGGTKLSSFIFESFYKKTNKKIREGYGLTETSPACSLNYQENDPVIGSVGIPLIGCDIRIIDEDDKECKPDEIGEICIKGDLVFKGYFNNEKTTNMVFKNDWLHTGDYGKKNKDGFIFFCGLKKNMINVGGNNVYPNKLKRLMESHINVISTTIYGEEANLQGQIVCAKIKLHDTSIKAQTEFKEWCCKNINNILLPKIWLFE